MKTLSHGVSLRILVKESVVIQQERVPLAVGSAAGAALGRPDTPCHTFYNASMGTAFAALVRRGSGCGVLWLASAEALACT